MEIREEYNSTVQNINVGFYEVKRGYNGETVYLDDGKIRAIIVAKNSNGEDYSKYYYYTKEGSLYFAYYEGSDANRLYFADNKLIRWLYSSDAADPQNVKCYDLENENNEYEFWEKLAQQESGQYLRIAEGTMEEQADYILPNSDSRYFEKEDLDGFTEEECRLAINEIYARHGRLFNDDELQAYFNSKEWYEGRINPEDFQESMLNDYEVYNRDLIVSYEEEKGYR